MSAWIARDKNGELYIYSRKPSLTESGKCFHDMGDTNLIGYARQLPMEMYPNVTFENSPKELIVNDD